jgi:hypothetical protein
VLLLGVWHEAVDARANWGKAEMLQADLLAALLNDTAGACGGAAGGVVVSAAHVAGRPGSLLLRLAATARLLCRACGGRCSFGGRTRRRTGVEAECLWK